MVQLFGREFSRQELLAYAGNLQQVAGVQLAEWSDGPERGVRIAQFRSGSGLSFTVLLDRGLDIGPAEFRGIPLAWFAPAGFTHPAYYEPEGSGWLRTYGGGLVVGCGLTNVGAPGEDEGEHLGLHGRLSVLPARNVNIGQRWEGDQCTLWLEGEVHQARLFGERLLLRRQIATPLGRNVIHIHDTVENLGDAPSPLMLLYHINLGFPLLDEGAWLESKEHPVRPRDADAEKGLAEWNSFLPPVAGYREQVFLHDLPTDDQGWADMALVNSKLGLKFVVRYHKASLPNLLQWKNLGRGQYVLGLEPANCGVEGRRSERDRGTLQWIQPDEQIEFQVEIRVEEG